MNTVKTRQRTRSDAGMVSIMVTLVMMLVISMIVLGFAQISRREQRQSLDRQLSSQAFLAAESGVNDARKVLQEAIQSGTPAPEKSECTNDPSLEAAPLNALMTGANPKSTLDSANNVAYTCLLVDTSLDSIRQVVSTDGGGVTIPIHPATSTVSTLSFKWIGDDGAVNNSCPASVPASGSFSESNNWPCDYGVLRVDMVPTDTLNRNTLLANQRAFYLYPTRVGGTPTLNYANARGATAGMSCNNANGDCRINITNISGSTKYALRLSAVYLSGTVEITAANGAGTQLMLEDAQALVDVTGKAQDVLRRVQVRLSLNALNDSAGYALQSGSSICKRFSVSDRSFRVASDILVGDNTNPMCRP